VRVRELANEDGAVSYATALAELFALHPDAVDAVTRPEGLA
jgi:glutamyl-tRNA reductase